MEKLHIINFFKGIAIIGESTENQEFKARKYSKCRHREYFAGIFLFLILLPESLIYSDQIKAALLFYAGILLVLSLISIFVKEPEIRNVCQAFLLLPVFRLINFSVPLFPEDPYLSLIFIYIPLIIPAVIIIIHQQITYEQLGLNFKNMQYFLPVSILIGLIFGQGESLIMKTTQLIPNLSILNIFKLAVVMIFCVGFIECLIFRSILQTRFEEAFGSLDGLILSSLIFGLMNSGYETLYGTFYAIFVGFLIGYTFQKTRNLPFIVLIQGFTNVFSFGVIPYIGHGLGIF